MNIRSKIFIAGGRGLVGSAIVRALKNQGFQNLLFPSSRELDLIDRVQVQTFFDQLRPEYVFLAAAQVGGIFANKTFPAEFIFRNLEIQNNVIECSHRYQVRKLLFLGSSCIYPKLARQPIRESEFLNGYLEETNKPYAVAKIAGIVMCQSFFRQYGCNFISVMPTNLYGLNDNYHPENSHVIPGMIGKFHEAKISGQKQVVLWGSGAPLREFLFSDDLAEACLFLMKNYDSPEIINIGSGFEVSIRDLAALVQTAVNFEGEIVFDSSKPDGTPRKFLDSSRINDLGWSAKTSIKEGLRISYADYLSRK